MNEKTGLIELPDQGFRRQEQAIPQPTSLIQAIASAASNPHVDMDRAERLFRMHQEMVKAESERAFNAAFARAQAKMIPVVNNARNEQTNSKYAKLAAINKAITPIYTAEGFAVSFNNGDSPTPGFIRILGTLSHADGHSRSYQIDMPPDEVGAKGNVNKTKVHATGSTNSYARRYLICQMWNVTTEDDTDGNAKRKVMPDAAVADWLAAIESAADVAAAEALWKQIAQAASDAGDISSYETLKAAMSKRVRALKAAA